jgi:hypothetical protein
VRLCSGLLAGRGAACVSVLHFGRGCLGGAWLAIARTQLLLHACSAGSAWVAACDASPCLTLPLPASLLLLLLLLLQLH